MQTVLTAQLQLLVRPCKGNGRHKPELGINQHHLATATSQHASATEEVTEALPGCATDTGAAKEFAPPLPQELPMPANNNDR